MLITLPIKDKLKTKTAIWGDNPNFAKEKVVACTKNVNIKKGNNNIRESIQIKGITKTSLNICYYIVIIS